MSNLYESIQVKGATLSPKVSSTTKQREYTPRKGIAFPFKNSGEGYINPATEVALAKANLKQLLGTFPGERLMLPSYGCNLESLLFEPFDEQLVVEAKERVINSISRFIPYLQVNRVRVVRLEESSKFGLPTLLVSVSCQIRDDENTIFEVDVKL